MGLASLDSAPRLHAHYVPEVVFHLTPVERTAHNAVSPRRTVATADTSDQSSRFPLRPFWGDLVGPWYVSSRKRGQGGGETLHFTRVCTKGRHQEAIGYQELKGEKGGGNLQDHLLNAF